MTRCFKHYLNINKGSITVEAAVSTPIFICIVLSVFMLMKIIYIEASVSSAINTTAKKISTYAYLAQIRNSVQNDNEVNLSKTRVLKVLETLNFFDNEKSINDFEQMIVENVSSETEETQKEESNNDTNEAQKDELKNDTNKSEKREYNDDLIKMINDIFEYMEKNENQKDLLENLFRIYLNNSNEISKNYLNNDSTNYSNNEFVIISSYIVKNGIDGLKNENGITLARYMVSKYINQEIFSEKNIAGAFIWGNSNDINKSFDFSETSIIQKNSEIDINVKYEIKINLPINIFPALKIRQRALTKAWLNGDGSLDANADIMGKSIWDLTPIKRGKIISDMEEKIEAYRDDILLEVRSIDVRTEYYKNPNNIYKTLQEDINDFSKKDAKEKNKIFRVIVPIATISSIPKEVLTKLIEFSTSKSIVFEIFEKYGK